MQWRLPAFLNVAGELCSAEDDCAALTYYSAGDDPYVIFKKVATLTSASSEWAVIEKASAAREEMFVAKMSDALVAWLESGKGENASVCAAGNNAAPAGPAARPARPDNEQHRIISRFNSGEFSCWIR